MIEPTPFRTMFGDYNGPFTYISLDKATKKQLEETGLIFKLLEDDGSLAPAFLNLNCNFLWDGRFDGDNELNWNYVRLDKLLPWVIATKEELELNCMLYPDLAEIIQETFDKGLNL